MTRSGDHAPLGPQFTNQSNTIMTEITAIRNGKIFYHSIEPRKMTEAQVKQDLEAWKVDTTNCTILIQYN